MKIVDLLIIKGFKVLVFNEMRGCLQVRNLKDLESLVANDLRGRRRGVETWGVIGVWREGSRF